MLKMGKIYLTNSFSLNMLNDNFKGNVFIQRNISLNDVKKILENGFINAVGHDATIQLINTLLNLNLKANRVAIKMVKNDVAIIVQIKERLPEGKILNENEIKTLYESNKIQFDLVEV